MSSLGIRNILPLRAANGLKIVNGVVSIDPLATINLSNIIMNPKPNTYAIAINTSDADNANALSVVESASTAYLTVVAIPSITIGDTESGIGINFVTIIGNDGIGISHYNGTSGALLNQTNITDSDIQISEVASSNTTEIIIGQISLATSAGSSVLNEKLITQKIQTTAINGGAPSVSIDAAKVAGIVVQTGSVNATVNGVAVKLLTG
jgi:hypothetical protein